MTHPAMRSTRGAVAPRDYRHYIDYAAYRAAGGYRALQDCLAGRVDAHALLRRVERIDPLSADGGPARLLLDGQAPAVRSLAVGNTAGSGQAANPADLPRLQHDPHRLLEGVLIAAWLGGGEEVHIVLHGPAGAACRELLEHEIACLVTELPVAELPRLRLCDAAEPAAVPLAPLPPLRTLFRLRGLAEQPPGDASRIVDGLHKLV